MTSLITPPPEGQREKCVDCKLRCERYRDQDTGYDYCLKFGLELPSNEAHTKRDIGTEVKGNNITPLTLLGGPWGSCVDTATESYGKQLNTKRLAYAKAAKTKGEELSEWEASILNSEETTIAQATIDFLQKSEKFNRTYNLQELWDLGIERITKKLEKKPGYNSHNPQWQNRSQEAFKQFRFSAAKNFIHFMQEVDPKYRKPRVDVLVADSIKKVEGGTQ